MCISEKLVKWVCSHKGNLLIYKQELGCYADIDNGKISKDILSERNKVAEQCKFCERSEAKHILI